MKICGHNISMTRGDSETITVILSQNDTDEEIAFSDGDIVDFTIRRRPTSKEIAVHKKITVFENGRAIVRLYPEDTKDMRFDTYWYDVQLTTADGTVATIIQPSEFTVRPEVSYE